MKAQIFFVRLLNKFNYFLGDWFMVKKNLIFIIISLLLLFIISCSENKPNWIGTYEGETGYEKKGMIILKEDNTYRMIIEGKMSISGEIIHKGEGVMELPYEDFEDNLIITIKGDTLIIDDTGIELKRKK